VGFAYLSPLTVVVIAFVGIGDAVPVDVGLLGDLVLDAFLFQISLAGFPAELVRRVAVVEK
jgi:hypothetical protein